MQTYEIRKLAFDLYTSDERDLVKMAGIFSGLKKFVRRLYTKVFQKERYRFESDNQDLKNLISEMYVIFKMLDKSIESYDLDLYKANLDDLKDKLSKLTALISKMENNVSEVKETAKEEAATTAPVISQTPQEKEQLKDAPTKVRKNEDSYADYLNGNKNPKLLIGQILGNTDAFRGLINEDNIYYKKEILDRVKYWLEKKNIKVSVENEQKLIKALKSCVFNGTIKILKVNKRDYNGNILFSVECVSHLDFTSPPANVKLVQSVRYDPNHQQLNVTHFDLMASTVVNPEAEKNEDSEGDEPSDVEDDGLGGDDVADMYDVGDVGMANDDTLIKSKPKHVRGNLGEDFYQKLIAMCNRLGMAPEDLLAVMQLESGMDPSIPNHVSGKAVGLIQFMPKTLKGLGLSGDEAQVATKVRNMTGVEQLPLIEQYIKSQMKFNDGRPFKSAAQYYIANFWPIALRYPKVRANDPSAVIVSENGPKRPHNEPAAYRENKALDLDHDGKITLGDLMNWMDTIKRRGDYKNTLSQLEAAGHTLQNQESEMPSNEVAKNESNDAENNFNLDSFINEVVNKIPISASANSLIEIFGNDRISNYEFARVLKSVLRNKLDIIASIHLSKLGFQLSFNNKNINVKEIHSICKNVNQSLIKTASLMEPIRFYVFENKVTTAKPINYRTAEQFYRMFKINNLIG